MKTNLLGKIFFAALGAWVAGKATNVMLRGSHSEIDAVENALLASKVFQDELRKPGATVATVIDKLNLKQASAREFERILGVPYPF